MKRKSLLAALAVSALALTGCAVQSNDAGSASTGKTKGFTYGVSLYASGDPFAAAMVKNVKSEAAKLGDKVIIVTDGKFDAQKQGNDVQDIIARKPDAMLLASGDTAQAKTWVDESVSADVPVFDLFNAIDHYGEPLYKGVSAGVQVDEKASGAAAAEIALKVLKPGDAAGVVLGPSGVAEVPDRLAGFTETLKKAGDYKVIPSPNGDWTEQQGQEACQDLISANPLITVVYSESDDMSAGCTKATNIGNVKVIGNAASTQGLNFVKSGVMLGTTCYGPGAIGRKTVDLAHKVLAGDKSLKGKLELIAPKPITADNLSDCTAEW